MIREAPKQSSLRASLVEANMFMKINKHLIPTNLEKVVSLDNKTWESKIPKRLALRLYDEGEEKEKKATSDDENEPV
jgi:hypothetical protein